MNFWDTEQAGFFAEAILENRDILDKENFIIAEKRLYDDVFFGWKVDGYGFLL